MPSCYEWLSSVVFLTIISIEYLRERREGEEERDTRDSCLPRLLRLRVPDLNLHTGASTLLGAAVLAVVRPLAEPIHGAGCRPGQPGLPVVSLPIYLLPLRFPHKTLNLLLLLGLSLFPVFDLLGVLSISLFPPFLPCGPLLLFDLWSFSATSPCCERLSLVFFLTIISGEYLRESREGKEERDTRDSCLPRLLGLRVPDLNLRTSASTLLGAGVLTVVRLPAEPIYDGRISFPCVEERNESAANMIDLLDRSKLGNQFLTLNEEIGIIYKYCGIVQ
ncbi:hypothetical protein M9H77_28306 [Catharanthus roseus]|uniref:Uncharacterized protein n=1 Tax=Catharanthus roseus TaxID=4058 RepID=A0ACC0AJ93_CATRO|nr:hypothetical protein M9H77_28306 [Catharanthus roseus]